MTHILIIWKIEADVFHDPSIDIMIWSQQLYINCNVLYL